MAPFVCTDMMVQITVISAFCFAENTIFMHEYFLANFVIPIDTCLVFMSCVAISLALAIIPYFVPVSYERYVKEHVPSKDCCTWWGFLYRVIGRASGPCGICEKIATSLSLTVSAMSISAVQSIPMIVWCTRSSIAFACGFLTLVSLRFNPYESHRVSKWSLNSLQLL